jgi:hypothetical protein
VVKSAVGQPLLGFLWRYVLERAANGGWPRLEQDVTTARGAYGDPVMEHVLERLRPSVEAIAGVSVYPTYSYVRLYAHGDALAAHRDRPACELSLSLSLGQEPPAPWPLWIRGPEGERAVALDPGDALLYRGIDCPHWREPLDGDWAAQVFLHYVDRIGPHAGWKFDQRASLAEHPFRPAPRAPGAGG